MSTQPSLFGNAHSPALPETTQKRVKRHGNTTLGDFGRMHRDLPYYNYLKVRLFLTNEKVPLDEVVLWLQDRFLASKSKQGFTYRTRTYPHVDGNRYVDQIFLEKMTSEDEAYITLKWGFSKQKVVRDGRMVRIHLPKAERARMTAEIDIIQQRYYDMQRQRLLAKMAAEA